MPRLAVFLFWSAALLALVMASVAQPVTLPGQSDDKANHIIAFVTLSLLAAWAYPRTRLLTIFVGLSLFGGLIELVQLIPAINRDADWFDWLADGAAAALTLFIVAALRRVRTPARSEPEPAK